MGPIRLFGVLLYFACTGVLRVGSFIFNWGLDLIYGPPQIATPASAMRVVPSVAKTAPSHNDFQPTMPMGSVNAKNASSTAASLPSELPTAAPQSTNRREIAVSERVKTAQVVGPQGIVYGVMWLYLFPHERKAKRLFKILDLHLAKQLKKDRFFFPDVPYDPKEGHEVLMDQLHRECKSVLNQRKPKVREKRTLPVASVSRPSMVSVPAVVEPQVPAAVPAAQHAAPGASVHGSAGATRHVRGDKYKGEVVRAASTKRKDDKDETYETFCLTINDGSKEIPLFGKELERQAHDQKVKPGDKVQVVFMGKQPTTYPGQTRPSYRNLYQLTVLERS